MSGESNWVPVAVMAAVGVVVLAGCWLAALAAASALAESRRLRDGCRKDRDDAGLAAQDARRAAARAEAAAADVGLAAGEASAGREAAPHLDAAAGGAILPFRGPAAGGDRRAR